MASSKSSPPVGGVCCDYIYCTVFGLQQQCGQSPCLLVERLGQDEACQAAHSADLQAALLATTWILLLICFSSRTECMHADGDTHLGGEDFDQNVMQYFIKLIKKKYGKDVSKDARALQVRFLPSVGSPEALCLRLFTS